MNNNKKPHSQPSAQWFPFKLTGAQVCRWCRGGNEYHNVSSRRLIEGKKKQNTKASARMKWTAMYTLKKASRSEKLQRHKWFIFHIARQQLQRVISGTFCGYDRAVFVISGALQKEMWKFKLNIQYLQEMTRLLVFACAFSPYNTVDEGLQVMGSSQMTDSNVYIH